MAINFLNITETLVEARINDNTVGSNLPTPRLTFKENGVVSGGISTTGGNLILETSSGTERVRITSTGNSIFSRDVTANGNYSAGQSAIIYKAQRSGGAVAGDWSYDDATTDMSLGTSTSHSFSLKTGNTRALTIDTSQNATFAGDASLADNKKIKLGAGNDLEIYHDTTDSYITNTTGDLTISNTGANSDDLILKSADDLLLYVQGTELAIQAVGNSGVILRHNNVVKFETTSGGIRTYGDILIEDSSPQIHFLDTTNNNDSYIYSDDQGSLNISADENNEQNSSKVRFYIDGSEKVRFVSNGNVGIGETSVDARLHITKGSAGLVNQKFESAGSAAWRLGIPASQTYFAFDNANDNLSSPKLVINSSGFVGIGSTNPVAPLEVKSAETNHLTLYRPSNTTEGNAGGVNFDGNDSDSNQQTYAKIESFTDDATAGSIAGKLSFSIAKGGDGMTSAMTIQKDAQVSLNQYGTGSYTGTAAYTLQVDSAGNIIEGSTSGGGTVTGTGTATRVAFWSGTSALSSDANLYWDNTNDRLGIGTTSPSYKLDVNVGTDNNVAKFESTDDTAQIIIKDNDTTMYFGARNSVGYISPTGSTPANGICVNTGGNVGIGTATPTQKLEVAGNLKMEGSILDIRLIESDTTNVNSLIRQQSGLFRVDTISDDENTITRRFTIDQSDGAIQFNAYGAGTLVSDASGNITSISGGGQGGPYLPLAGGTMTGDVTFNDNVLAKFGTSSDLRIQHSSGNNSSYIQNYTGDLLIENQADDKDIIFRSDDGDGGVETYFYLDGSSAESGGAARYTRFPTDSYLGFGDSINLEMFWSTNGVLRNKSGDLFIDNYANDSDIKFRSDDGSGSQTEYFRLDGALGYMVASKQILFNDNVKAKFGSSGDLEIFHDGSNSYISDVGTGELLIRSNLVAIQNSAGTENMAKFDDDAGVKLFYDDSQKFETTSSGVKVTSEGYQINIQDSSSGNISEIVTSNNAMGFFADRANSVASTEMIFSVDNTTALTIDDSQNATFAGEVEVINANGLITGRSSSSASTNSSLRFMGGAYTGNKATAILYDGVSGENQLYLGGGTSLGEPATNIRFHTGSAGATGAGTERMRIDSSGNIGIGMTPDSAVRLSVSGQIGPTNGTAAAPTHTFYGDDDTGMFRAAANNLAFSSGGSERMRIDSSGNVGIGTTNAQAKLDVQGQIRSTSNIVSNSGYDAFYIGSSRTIDDYGGLYKNYFTMKLQTPAGAHAYGDLRFQLANSTSTTAEIDVMTLSYTGDVGIGTTSPSSRLTVVDNSNILSFNEHGSQDVAELKLIGDTAHDTAFYFGDAADNVRAGFYYDVSANQLQVRGYNNGTYMAVSSNGRIGIGTTSPEQKLHVKASDATAIIKIEGGNSVVTAIGEINSRLEFGSNDSSVNSSGNVGGSIESVTEHSNGAITGLAFSTFYQSRTPNDLAEAMRITGSGNVGIGTTAPTELLHLYHATTNTLAYLQSGDATTVLAMADNDGSTRIESDSGEFRFRIGGTASTAGSNTTEAMRINSSGNVGIASTSPTSTLTIGSTTDNQTLSLGQKSSGNQSGRTVLIEGVANTSTGEGSGRIFFTEHNSTEAGSNLYGVALTYSGDTSPQFPSGSVPGLGNAKWALMRHHNSLNGASVIYGSRTDSDVYFANNIYMPNALLHVNDTNTYIQFHAADQFRVVTGGTERFEVNNTQVTANSEFIATGAVGIGTTSPNTKLHVSSDVGFPQIRFQETSIAEPIGLRFQAENSAQAQVYADIKFDPDSAELIINNPYNSATQGLTVDSSSNVLVGNDLYVPDQIIHTGDTDTYLQFNGADSWRVVAGNVERLLVNTTSNTVRGSNDILRIQSTSTTGNPQLSFYQTTTRRSFIQHHDSNDNLLIVSEYGGVIIKTGTGGTETEKMRLTSAGNVGIGTTDPAELLNVNKENAESVVLISRGGSNVTTSTDIGKIKFSADYDGSIVEYGNIKTYSNSLSAVRSSMDFNVKSTAGNIITGMTVYGTSSGVNVGIGTTSPAEKLTVSGNANVTSKFAVGITSVHASFDFYNQGTAYFNGATTIDDNLSMNGDINFGSSNGNINMSRGSFIRFYEDSNSNHGIGSRSNTGGEADDIRINSYGAVYVNLDSNNNNTSGADFVVGHHGAATGTISELFRVSGEDGRVGVGTTTPGTVNGTAFGGVMLHAKGSGNIGRLVLEGAVQGTMLMNATGSTANQRLKFIQSKQNEFRMGKVSDSGTETTQLAIDDAGDVILQAAGKGLVLVSPDGTTYRLSVTNDGELETTLV